MGSLPAADKRRAIDVGGAFRALLQRTARRVAGGTRSPATLEMQREHVRYLLERIDRTTPVARLTPRRIARVLEQESAGRKGRALSGCTLRKRAYTLSQALELARGRAPQLPEIPYLYEPRTRFLETFDDYERLRDRLSAEHRLFFVAAVWTGQRRSNVAKMVKEDFDPRGPEPFVVVRSSKTRGGRVKIHAAPELVRELAAHWERLPAGAKLVPAWPGVNSSLRWHCQKLGLPLFSTHALRHTFFTWYVAANGFTAELLEIGGWKDLRIPALVYAHALPVRFRGQIERTVALATSLRRGPRKSPDVGTPEAQLRLPRSAGEDFLGSGLRSSSPGVTRTTGTNSLRDEAKRIGPPGGETPGGPDASPEGTLEAGLDRKSRSRRKEAASQLVPRDRVELSTHGFSDPCEPALAVHQGRLPMEGPPCPQEPRPAPT